MTSKKFYSACALNCPDLCAFVVEIEDGKIIRLEGDENHLYTLGRCCPKGYGHVLRHSSEDRLLYPMKKQADGSHQRISWDEALDEIAKRMGKAKAEHGVESVGIYSGSGNDGMAPRYASRFCSYFGNRLIPGIVEICFEGAYAGARFNVGPFPPHELQDWTNSKCIVIWGTNKFESSVHTKRIIREAIDNGAKLIVIDPRKIPHAAIADIYTTIRPGTDGALALGLANIIIKRGLYNKEFIQKHVIGFEEFTEAIKKYDTKTVSEITWVDENTIERIALMFAKHEPALIMTAPAGMNHYTNGTWSARAVHSLLVICGYIGISGGGFQYLSSDNSPFNGEAITMTQLLPEEMKPVVPSGTYLPEYVLNHDESPLKVLVIQAGNPITQWPNTTRVSECFQKIPFLICIDQMMTDTAKMCDIVLPATTLFEHHNLVHSELHRIVQYSPRLVEPLGEARHELEIWLEIANRMGFGEEYKTTEIDAIKMALDTEECRHITVEELTKHPEGIRTTSPSIVFEDNKFGTSSGKIELYSTELENGGYNPLPFFEEPLESPISTPDVYEEYPLIMITGRLRERLHSQFTTIEVGGSVRSYSHCTTCQKCVKECPDEAIEMKPPNIREINDSIVDDDPSASKMRKALGSVISNLAVKVDERPLEIPDSMTGLLVPVWDTSNCIGCRECQIDVCPYEIVNDPIRRMEMNSIEEERSFLRMHPTTAEELCLLNGDIVRVESKRGAIDRMHVELTDKLDPRVVWASDGWWTRDGNVNLLTDDKHTAFGHTPGFNSVLVKVELVERN